MGFNQVTNIVTVADTISDKAVAKRFTIPVQVDMGVAPVQAFAYGSIQSAAARVLTLNLTSTNSPTTLGILRSISFGFVADATSEQPSVFPFFVFIPTTGQVIPLTPTNRGYGANFTPMPIDVLVSSPSIAGNIAVIPISTNSVQLVQLIDDPSNSGPRGSINFNNFELNSFIVQS